jgi:alkaline phosphatase D
VNTRITPDSPTVDYRCVPQVGVKGAAAFTRATFVVDDGVRGLRQTYDNPGRLRSALAPRSDAQKIRDTLEAGSH